MQCTLTLRPHMSGRQLTHMEVHLALDELHLSNGAELCRMQLETVSIPGCHPEELHLTDGRGEVPLVLTEDRSYPYVYLICQVQRETTGPLSLRYTVSPRPYAPEQSCGPYFDLKAEDGGANAAGLSFLPSLAESEGDIRLHWDLSAMPAGAMGVNTFGEGDLSYTGSFEKLRQSYYAMGLLHRITRGDFGFYWLAEPSFDVEAIAAYVQRLYEVMAPFFRDTESVYRVFVRRDPDGYPGSGGTALLRSYMFGWNENKAVSVTEKQNILAHEMVHNWPQLNDEPYGTTTWYSEGTAEYYSILLPLRAGLIDRETALQEIQSRSDAYYTNPTRHLDNQEAARRSWEDRRIQKLPYGRGIFFLANADVQIRAATDSRCGIDDVVLELLRRDRAGEPLGNEVFLQVVREVSGLDLRPEWTRMCSGSHFAPLPGSFDGLFTVEELTGQEADTGNAATVYRWQLR